MVCRQARLAIGGGSWMTVVAREVRGKRSEASVMSLDRHIVHEPGRWMLYYQTGVLRKMMNKEGNDEAAAMSLERCTLNDGVGISETDVMSLERCTPHNDSVERRN
jgi:hypothetical protein